jgi:hypothetical protein
VPGAYAFRVVLGALQIAHGVAAPPLVAETLALGITVVLMVAAIGVGIAAKNRGGSTTGVQYAGH